MTISSTVKTKKSQPNTLILTGIIKNKEPTILVDSSSTHNCVYINVVKEIKLFLHPTMDLTINIVDRHHTNDKGIYQKIYVQLYKD